VIVFPFIVKSVPFVGLENIADCVFAVNDVSGVLTIQFNTLSLEARTTKSITLP
jgi:hypothetical protein